MVTSAGKRVIMLLANSLYPYDIRVHGEATSLAACGYQVTIICPRFSQRERQPWREVIDGVHVYRYPIILRRFDVLGYAWGYAYTLVTMSLLTLYVFVRNGFDIIHAHNPPDVLFIIAAFYKVLGKRFVYDQHDLASEMYGAIFKKGNRLFYRILLWFEKLSYQMADHVIVTNQSYKQIAIQRGAVPEKRITIVRNGPDLNILRPLEPDLTLRRDGKVTIGYVGAMGLHDGVDYLLRAFQHLIHDLGRTDFFCVCVGGGKLQPKMKTLSEQMGLTDYVWFTGRVDHSEVARYLSAADICVAPEPSNGYNDRSTMIKVGEYMAVGKPIVAFDLPEHRFTAQGSALYAQPNNELDFARKIALLMDDPEQRHDMGRIGLERAKAELAWPYQAEHLQAVYRSLKT